MPPLLDAARPLGWSEPGRTTREITTGGWRTRRPVWIEAQAPCRGACPAGEPIPRWIDRARAGDLAGAWSLIREENPFPAVTGRVCAHPCERACNRAAWDSAVSINALERFVGDWGLAHGGPGEVVHQRSERVAVIGGGPAGLACAYHLAKLGYRVTLFEAEAELGGVLRHGIPPYRLPRAVLDREIDLVLALGIQVENRHRITRDGWEALEAWAAVFLATGAPVPLALDVTGARSNRVTDGLELLRAVSLDERPTIGERVAVIGGGSTAMDVARTARRLGAPVVTVLALETRDTMPADAEEVTQALDEGVEIRHGVGVRSFRETSRGIAVILAPAHLGRDARGAIVPVFEPGPETELPVDRVLLAIGQRPDPSGLPPSLTLANGVLGVGADGTTSAPRIFAGGDLGSRERTVAQAIGSGTRAARAIHAKLSGAAIVGSVPPPRWATERSDRVVPPTRIGTHAFARAERAAPVERLPSARIGSFVEVVDGFDERAARSESARCFTCGHCIACDVCLRVCPDMAISCGGECSPLLPHTPPRDAACAGDPASGLRLDDRPGDASRRIGDNSVQVGYVLDSEHCKGCGLCVRECPRGALEMEDER